MAPPAPVHEDSQPLWRVLRAEQVEPLALDLAIGDFFGGMLIPKGGGVAAPCVKILLILLNCKRLQRNIMTFAIQQ